MIAVWATSAGSRPAAYEHQCPQPAGRHRGGRLAAQCARRDRAAPSAAPVIALTAAARVSGWRRLKARPRPLDALPTDQQPRAHPVNHKRSPDHASPVHRPVPRGQRHAGGGCPIEAGLLGRLADHECRHGRLAHDHTPKCGCCRRTASSSRYQHRHPTRPSAAGAPSRVRSSNMSDTTAARSATPAEGPDEQLIRPKRWRLLPASLQRATLPGVAERSGAGARAHQRAIRACIEAAQQRPADLRPQPSTRIVRELLARYRHPTAINGETWNEETCRDSPGDALLPAQPRSANTTLPTLRRDGQLVTGDTALVRQPRDGRSCAPRPRRPTDTSPHRYQPRSKGGRPSPVRYRRSCSSSSTSTRTSCPTPTASSSTRSRTTRLPPDLDQDLGDWRSSETSPRRPST